jgi:gamma-glutamyltranspeptidase/glutathione hydrolase
MRKPEALLNSRRALHTVLVAVTLWWSCGAHAASRTPVAAEHGMVVTAHRLATEVGVDVLKRGGNAIDAAVAVGYALAVVFPVAGNIGGGGFMTIQLADGRTTFLDFRERAPLAASANMFLDANGNIVSGLSTKGFLAAGIPGTVSGLEMARSEYGSMSRSDLLAPAIKLATDGFVLRQGDVDEMRYASADLKKDAAASAIFFNQGAPYRVGERLVQKDLAFTLTQISQNGVAGFYQGPVEKALVAASVAGGGIFSDADFASYTTREMAPVQCDYRGYHIVSSPPPSSGGVILCEILNIVEGYPLKELGFHSADAIHYQIEAMRHAYVDRNSYLADPAFNNNPLQHLLDKQYAAQIRAVIDPDHAGISQQIKPGVAPHEGVNTTHFSIVDQAGNAVSMTYTLNLSYGARVVAAGTGVILNDEMDDFTSRLNSPNSFGLIQGQANSIAPGKRPLSSMTPTIVTRDGKPVVVLGTPGGSTITTAVALCIINLIDYGMNVQEAIDAPRFHQQWMPESTGAERFAISPDTEAILKKMGHQLRPMGIANEVAAIVVGAPSLNGNPIGANRFYGVMDPRSDTGEALGY